MQAVSIFSAFIDYRFHFSELDLCKKSVSQIKWAKYYENQNNSAQRPQQKCLHMLIEAIELNTCWCCAQLTLFESSVCTIGSSIGLVCWFLVTKYAVLQLFPCCLKTEKKRGKRHGPRKAIMYLHSDYPNLVPSAIRASRPPTNGPGYGLDLWRQNVQDSRTFCPSRKMNVPGPGVSKWRRFCFCEH